MEKPKVALVYFEEDGTLKLFRASDKISVAIFENAEEAAEHAQYNANKKKRPVAIIPVFTPQ